jgi:YVTN family beta-propeller protein
MMNFYFMRLKQATQLLLFFFTLLHVVPLRAQVKWIASPPAGNLPARIEKSGIAILPNGRIVSPLGKQIVVAPHPYGLVLSADGTIAVTANSGTSPLSITIIRNITGEQPEVQQIPPGASTDKGVLASVFMGLAISRDNSKVYVAGGETNQIYSFNLKTGVAEGSFDCAFKSDTDDYSNGYIGDLVLTKDGRTIYAVDQLGFRIVIIDVASGRLKRSIRVGRYPFGIALSPDEKRIYVANVGMYEYKFLESLNPKDLAGTALDFPAASYNSELSQKGVSNDKLKIPPLGEPNSLEAFSVWAIDVEKEVVVAKIKTGFLVGDLIDGIPAVGGSSPNSLIATNEFIFVSNGSNDCVSVIDSKSNKVVENIFLKPDPRVAKFRGVIPFGLALSPDQKKLFVAEAGINAVAVIDVTNLKVIGHIPTAWFPSKLAVTPDNKKLIVSNAKGFGSGPNGGANFTPGEEGSNIGRLMKGVVSVFEIPSDVDLIDQTKKVVNNNFVFRESTDASFTNRSRNPIPLFPSQRKSPIKYWVFISKENRTFDEVFGQLASANGDGTIARYGENVVITNRSGKDTVNNTTVMPNHLALARQFSLSDNFFVDADHSADGHRWLVGTYPNQWVETSTSASYGGNRSAKRNSKAPGNLAVTGSSSAIYPEDYNEAGSIWDHFDRHKITYFNFGLGLGLTSRIDDRNFKLGVKYLANHPLPGSLVANSSRIFPVYNTAIPDQYRVDMFIKEYQARWADKNELPAVMTLRIPNDHGAGERAEDGYPFTASYMADNDLAIGRTVEFLSRTKYWKDMAIVITEDDAQGGVDHVDAHRSVLLVISPYAKRKYVGHVHYSFGSIFKTIWNSLGIPHLNQYDFGASDMADLFTDKPDFTPYNAQAVDTRIFDPYKALTPNDAKFNWKALEKNSDMDHPAQMLKDSKELDEQQKKKRKKN